MIAVEELWERLAGYQGEIFYTAKKLPFTFTIRGREMFVDRRQKSITQATFQKALQKIEAEPEKVTGPKSLGVFGAPYVYAILVRMEVIRPKP